MTEPTASNLHDAISIERISQILSVPLLCDALDAFGFRNQSPRIVVRELTASPSMPSAMLVGNCKTMLWADMSHVDENPYELELSAVDSCQPGDVIVCAAGGSMRSGIWGELLSHAARNAGCAGAVVHGAVRDVKKMCEMRFPVYASGTSPFDSRDRQRVINYDVAIEIDGVRIEPGDLVAADEDGVVFVPKRVVDEVLAAAWAKAHDENRVRDAIRAGMSARNAFEKFGVL